MPGLRISEASKRKNEKADRMAGSGKVGLEDFRKRVFIEMNCHQFTRSLVQSSWC